MLKSLKRTKANFPQIGILHKGAPKTTHQRDDGSEYTKVGKDLDHFRLEAEPDVLKVFTDAFGEAPREIPVYLRTAKAIDSFDANNEEFDSTGLKRRCDGEFLLGERFGDRNKPFEPEKWHAYTDYDERPCYKANGGCKCTERGYLRFIIPQLAEAGHLGEILFTFGSIYDIHEIYANLMAFEGDARQCRFLLRRVQKKITASIPGNAKKKTSAKRMKVDKWMVQIIPEPQFVVAMIERARFDSQFAMAPAEIEQPLLVEPEPEVVEAQAELLPPEPAGITQQENEALNATIDIPDEDLVAASDVELQRIGFTPRHGRQLLMQLFEGVTSRSELSSLQLRIFLTALMKQPTAQPVTTEK